MGVGGFFQLLGLRHDRRHISEFKKWRIGLDGTGFFCRGVYSGQAATANGDPTDAVITGLELLLKKMIRYDVHPVLFLDGDNLPAKYETQQKRRKARLKQQLQYHRRHNDDDGWMRSLSQYKATSSDHQTHLVLLAQRLNIPYQVALYEMDSQGVYSLRENDVDMIATSDSDFAVYGCRNIFFDCDENGWGYYFNPKEDIPLALNIPDEEYSPEMVLKMALLRGNDFYGGVPGIGPQKCVEVVKAAAKWDVDSLLQTVKELYPIIHAKIPSDCRDRLLQAELTFRHATVYDVTTQRQVPLTPVESPVLQQQISIFAGPFKDPISATAISKGLLHPITHQAIANVVDLTTGFWSSSYRRPQGVKIFVRGKRKSVEEMGLDDCDAAPKKKKRQQKWECHICKKTFSRFWTMKRHIAVHSGKKPFECSRCGKCFNRQFNLDAHAVIHANVHPYNCGRCGKSFKWRTTYSRHLGRHKGAKPYPCSICDKSFSRRDHLMEHINTHTGLRPFICDVAGCGKVFAHSANLLVHKKTHFDNRPYTCSSCSKSFKAKQTLQHHMITKHGAPGGGVKCSICEKTFPTKIKLQKHLKTHG